MIGDGIEQEVDCDGVSFNEEGTLGGCIKTYSSLTSMEPLLLVILM